MPQPDAENGYSIEAAIAYAREKIAYCDRIAAEWPDAIEHMTALRVFASRFLSILERDPKNVQQLRPLLEDLRSDKANAGTGWTMLTDWVDTYLARIQKERART